MKGHPAIWRVLKITGIAVAVLLLLFGGVTWVVFQRKNVWLLNQIESYVNQAQSGQLHIGSIDMKLFSNFPDVTIALDSIDYFEHRDSVRLAEEEPILHASQLFVAIELWPLLHDKLVITEVSLSTAQLKIKAYRDGKLNLNHALAPPSKPKPVEAAKSPVTAPVQPKTVPEKKSPTAKPVPAAKTSLQIDLQSVSMSNIKVTWVTYSDPRPNEILIKEWETELIKGDSVLNISLTSSYAVKKLRVHQSALSPGDVTFQAAMRYEPEGSLWVIDESKLVYDAFSATMDGTVNMHDAKIDLQVDASSNDLALLSAIVKPEIIRQNPDLLKQGDIYLKGRVFGDLKDRLPQFDVDFGIKDLTLKLPENLGTIQKFGFQGSFVSGRAGDYSDARVEVRNLNGQLPGGFLNGHFNLTNFVDPYVSYDLAARLKVDGYDRIFKFDFLSSLRGTISLAAKYTGLLSQFDKHKMDSSRSSALILDSLSFVVNRTNQVVSGLSGKLETRNNRSSLKEFGFTYGRNDLRFEATIGNLAYYLLGKEKEITISGSLHSKALHTRDFLFDSISGTKIDDRISNLEFDFEAKVLESEAIDSTWGGIEFDIRNLKAGFDELPDIRLLNTRGRFSNTAGGIRLDLNAFHAVLPQGKVEVSGGLVIPKQRQWQFNAQLKLDKLPWVYVQDVIAEMREGMDPGAKHLPVKEMELITSRMDVSASIITYPFDVNRVEIRNANVVYQLPDSRVFSVQNADIGLGQLFFGHPDNAGYITGLKSTAGHAALTQLKLPGLEKLDIHFDVTGKDDQLDFDFVSATQKAESENGKFHMDFSGKEFTYRIRYAVKKVEVNSFVEKFYKQKLLTGKISYVIDLETAGSTWAIAKQNFKGYAEISGDSLQFHGLDIDDALRKYQKSQNFNLTDLGAVLVAGPVGLAVTKGTDFVSLATISANSGKHTTIQSLLTRWHIENQVLTTEDVALATLDNRIAFDGAIDLGHDSIPGLTIAVVDKYGCSLMDQKVYGKMNDLKKGKLNIAKTLVGSVINFVNAIVGKDCKPIYTGKVKAP